MTSSEMLGTQKVNKLIFSLGWPASLNFLVVTIYNLTDAIFVGKWLGSMQIAAVVIVGTVTFLFSSFGLAAGIGGSSIIARALGEKDKLKAAYVFGNQILLALICSFVIVVFGWIFEDFILRLFGANGGIYPYASTYYRILLFGVPFLSLSMMANNVIHTQGKAKIAMFNSLLPTIINIALNPIFIKGFDMGIAGSAWATMFGYVSGFLLALVFFLRGSGEVKFSYKFLTFKTELVREISQIGGSILLNIGAGNLFTVLLNQALFKYHHEAGVVIYSIINRVNMLFIIPLTGIDGGIRPIIGYNFGSQQTDRIRHAVNTGIKYGMIICCLIVAIIFLSADYFIHLFTNDPHIIAEAPKAMKIVFSFFPLFVVEIITVAYFQAIGRPQIAFGLTLLRNVILLIPLLYILSSFLGYRGILYAFPIVDIIITIPAFLLLRNELNFKLTQRWATS